LKTDGNAKTRQQHARHFILLMFDERIHDDHPLFLLLRIRIDRATKFRFWLCQVRIKSETTGRLRRVQETAPSSGPEA